MEIPEAAQAELNCTGSLMSAQVKGVVDGGKRYSVGKAKTLRKLILAFGSHKRQFYMDVISSKGCTGPNSPINSNINSI